MSRINRWKLDKTKVKVVFRLQFHATHIPQSGWDKLFITFIPVDSGKATSKTTKANVRNGSCKWADPIYETTQLLQDIKTKQYDEKLYKFVISMGSSRSSILGESIINLADYADALRPSVVSLPLHGCDSGATLHVTVQLLTSKTGFREFEQQREVRERGLQKDQNSPDESSAGKLSYGGDSFTDHIDKANHGVRVSRTSKDLASRVEELGSRDESADSATGFDGSSNASESVYAEKHDTSSTHEIDSVQSAMSGDVAAVGRSPQVEKGDHSEQQISMQGTSDWVRSCNSDFSMDNDLSVAFEENSRLRGNLELAESCILELQTEVRTLQSHADQIGYEAQEFAKQLAAEIASGEKLTKEVSVLKSECSELKDELEKLKPSKLSLLLNSEVAVEAGQDGIQDLQLTWLKGLIIMEDKIREVQKKACFGYHDTGLGSLNSDLEALLSSLEILKQKTGLSLSSVNWIPNMEESEKMGIYINQKFATGTGLDVDLNPPDIGMLPCLNIPALISQETNSVDANDALKGKVFELLRDLDESKSERESLVKKMNEMECYYEALVQELEENQRQMVGELQNLRNEHSTCLYTISSHKADMEAMHHDLNNRMLRLAEDKLALETLNNELERRAVSAEAALKRARLNYSIAVDQLQKDLELLSSQVVSMFETNENLIRQAFIDFSQQNQQALPDIVSGYKFNSRDIQTMKLVEFQNQFVGINNQHSSGDNLLNDIKRSLHLQEGVYRKVEEEVHDLHFVNVYLDVFSKVLQETLLEAHGDKKLTNKKITELVQQIGVLTDAKEILMQKLHASMDDIRSLDQSKAICIAECNDLALENQNLKSSIHKAAVENQLLLQKLNEWESLVVQCEGYQSKYETCAAEKTELAYLLEMRRLENDNLQNENVALQEQLKTVKAEFDDLASKKENMQNSLTFAQSILQKLLAAQDERFDKLPKLQEYGSRETDIAAVLVQLEERQNTANDKFLQLIEENKGLVLERDNAQISIATLESEIVSLKNKFRHEMHNMVCKFDMSNKWVEKLQLDIESLAERLQRGEVEENFTCHQNGLLSYLDHLEFELQDIISKNRNIAPEFVDLEIIELEKSKSTVEELTNECQKLRNRLHEKTEESSRLASELQNLKESFQLLRDENHVLMASSDDKLQEYTQLVSECKNLKDSLLSLQEENQSLAESSKSKSKKAAKLELELQSLKEELQHLHDDNNNLVASSRDNTEESLKLSLELRSLKDSFQSLSDEKVALIAMSQSKTEEAASLALELKGLKDSLQSLHDQNEGLMACLKEKDEEALKLSSEVSRLEQTLQSLHDENQVLVVRSTEKSEESAKHEAEIISLRERLQSLLDENQVLVARSTEKSKESADHEAEIISLRERLQSLVDENQVLVARSTKKLEESANHEAEIISLRERLQSLLNDNQVLVAHTTEKSEESSKQEAEIVSLRERLQSLLDENQVLVARYAEKLEESAKHEAEMISLRERMQSLLDEIQVLVARSTEKSEESAKHEEEIISLSKRLQSLFEENQVLVARSREKSEESAKHETEIIRLSELLQSLLDENQALVASSVDKAKECAQLASDLNSSKVKLESLYNEMVDERNLRDELQKTNKDLTSELHLSQSQLEKCESQLAHFKQSVIDLQAEKARQSHLLSNYEEYLRSAHEKSFMISDLQTQLLELHELLIAAEIRLTFTESQLQNRVEELVQQLCQSETQIDELQKKYSHLESSHNSILVSEQQYLEEKAMLSTSLNTLKSELEASIAKNRLLSGTNQAIVMELEEHKKKMLDMGLHQSEEKQQHSFEVEKLYQEIISSGEEIESLMLSNEAREVDIIILRAKLEEMQAQVSSMDEHHSEVVMLQKRCGELSQKLSDQVTKTEEFRNLSVHLKELKDEAEANYNQIREKRESEAAPAAPQESLRIAFIKEQYETRVQELQHQLSMSKRHGEEILLKLQDAIDEVENRRKSEVSYHKKTEELGMKILELEDELQSVLAGKREKMMAYDLMKAEKECSLISLECCKEEKQKLEVTLEELKEENAKLSAELATVKTSLEDLRSTLKVQEEEKQNLEASIQGLNEEISKLAGELTITKESLEQARSTAKEPGEENDESCSDESDSVTCRVANISSGSLSTSESTLWSKLDGSRDYKEAGSTCSATFIGVGIANALENVDGLQEILVPNGDTSPFASDGRLMDGEQKQQSDHLRAESLRSSLDHLNNELERMKNENSFTDDDHDFTEKFPGLERELAQLQKVNEELRGMFPSFNEISVNGNALERVLALEIELADALRTNKGSSIHFQSSFVKQHSDEEAVFKSFKDINELIKEMLEVKGRYADVETELKDMHDRYSKLSLQFAEVEGERQKLLMTLKNVRASKKGQQLNRTSSTTLEDHSPFP